MRIIIKTMHYLVDITKLSTDEKNQMFDRLDGASFITLRYFENSILKGFSVTWNSDPQIFMFIADSFPNSRYVDVTNWDLSNLNYAFWAAFASD